jgi:hypothetical protein
LNTINYEVFEGTALAFLILVSGVIFLRTWNLSVAIIT